MWALFLYDFALAVASGTCDFASHHAKKALLCAHDASGTFAVGTSLNGTTFGSATVTVCTGYIFFQLELLCHSVCNLLQSQLYLYPLVAASEFGGACVAATETSETFDRYTDMLTSFAAMVRGEKQNPYTLDYELELYKTVLKACGEKI